jgi:hypothetical protein
MWFLIPWLLDKGLKGLFPKLNKLLRATILVALIPAILLGFSELRRVNIKRQIQARRPNELKKVLNQASSDFLTHSVVYKSDLSTAIAGTYRMDLLENPGDEIILTLPNDILFLDERYQKIGRLNLGKMRFNIIEPLCLDERGSYGFLAYRYGKGVWLLDSEANELWSQTEIGGQTSLHPDGAQSGDIDGDGIPEFAVYYRYRDGIHLFDVDGNIKWKHSVSALGHLEVVDLNGDDHDETIYTNSNNANGKTTFTILDATGTIADQMEMATESYEFDVINWPVEDSDVHVLLTEENTIRIVDLDGQTLMSLDAPGCRPFGGVTAVAVKFEKDEPRYLVAKKNLHPDISVLYVYDCKGKLVYQKTEAMRGVGTHGLVVVPVVEIGDEKLLMGSIRNYHPFVLEYFLAGKTGRKDTPALKKTE